MAQMLLFRRPSDVARQARSWMPPAASRRPPQDAGAPARGILLALVLSAAAWICLALALPRFW